MRTVVHALGRPAHASSLTVDFHEGGFVSQLNAVNAQRQRRGLWFEFSGEQKEDAE
jgi:hypothetical protein